MTEREIAGQAGNDETERIKPAMRGNESAMRKDDINVSSYGRDGATEGCSGSNGCFSVFTLCKDSRN